MIAIYLWVNALPYAALTTLCSLKLSATSQSMGFLWLDRGVRSDPDHLRRHGTRADLDVRVDRLATAAQSQRLGDCAADLRIDCRFQAYRLDSPVAGAAS
jgi:hypothetical protein